MVMLARNRRGTRSPAQNYVRAMT